MSRSYGEERSTCSPSLFHEGNAIHQTMKFFGGDSLHFVAEMESNWTSGTRLKSPQMIMWPCFKG